MNFKHYLFDLDGTLTDSSPGIVNSVLSALKMTGAPVLPREKLMAFLGPPLMDSFRNYCGASEEEAQELLRHYRKYYAEKGILENALYAGIPELLDALHRSGVSIYMATSKPEYFARQIVDHFGLSRYFAFIGGSTMDETRTQKEDVIRYVLAENGLDPADCLMIGDRYYDLNGARKCGMMCAAMLYGYGSREELASADFLIEKPQDLLRI